VLFSGNEGRGAPSRRFLVALPLAHPARQNPRTDPSPSLVLINIGSVTGVSIAGRCSPAACWPAGAWRSTMFTALHSLVADARCVGWRLPGRRPGRHSFSGESGGEDQPLSGLPSPCPQSRLPFVNPPTALVERHFATPRTEGFPRSASVYAFIVGLHDLTASDLTAKIRLAGISCNVGSEGTRPVGRDFLAGSFGCATAWGPGAPTQSGFSRTLARRH